MLIQPGDTIPRGADLTDADIEQLATDALDIRIWGVPKNLRRDEVHRQLLRTFLCRLGRIPSVQP